MRNTEKVDNILSQANKPVSLNMPKPDDDENADIEDKAKEQKNIERTEKYMQRFGDFLSFKNENTNSVSYGPLSRIPTNCQKAKDFINIFCQNYSSFISEHYESMGWSKTVATCSTVKMDTSTNTYLIYFSYPLDESDVLSKFPTINFIRLVPGDD